VRANACEFPTTGYPTQPLVSCRGEPR
jgi:hypothetical protein